MVIMTHPSAPHRVGGLAADRLEPRALRTRTLILDAIRAAATDTPLDDLTVAEVCRRAGVHRVTFYGHWADVRAATADAFAEVIDRLATVENWDVAATTSPADLADRYERALREQLIEIRDRRPVYRALIRSSGFTERLLEVLENRAQLAVDALVRLGADVRGAETGIAAAHLAGGVVAASARWAESDSVDADTAVAEFSAQLPAWWPRRNTGA